MSQDEPAMGAVFISSPSVSAYRSSTTTSFLVLGGSLQVLVSLLESVPRFVCMCAAVL